MSRVGKKPILIPENAEVKIEGQNIMVKGPKGELCREIRPEIKIELRENKIFVLPPDETNLISSQRKKMRALWGSSRAILANMLKGVTEGYEKKLEIEGIGYRALLEGEDISLYVGFSHPVKIKIPEGLKILVEKNIITVSGINKESVGQMAAQIRKTKPPEPYKGKGIKYLGEQIRRKVGKKVVTAAK